jgi:hypothetical protein
MKNLRVKGFIFAAAAFVAFSSVASAQRYKDGVVDKTIAVVGNEVIMISDLEEEVKIQSYGAYMSDMSGRCDMLEQMMEAKLFLMQARLDSLAAVRERERLAREKVERDSLAAVQALKDKGCMMYELASLKGLSSGELDHRYYFVVGSFRDGANADKFIRKVAKDTLMSPVKIHFRTGMIAVGVCPHDKIAEMASVIDDVRAKSFCPKDAWILVNAEQDEVE